ncbi:MAG TPA: carbohydrate porin, partial [Bacteroidota bacterium]
TWGIFGEYSESDWSLRAAAALEPKSANGLEMDTRFTKAFSVNMEFECRYEWRGHDGALRFLFYRNQAHMGNYDRAISDSISQCDITRTRLDGRTKYGLGLNWEQHVTDNGGMFVRLGWSDGVNETWAYTEIDRTFSLGGILGGQGWNRPLDHVGMAGVINALSRDHLRYLAAGGTGFLLGDGRLRYGPEMIVETFYSALIIEWMTLTADYQFIGNPAYNRDRGPVHVFGLRMHTEL